MDLFHCNLTCDISPREGGGGYSGFQVTGMIKWRQTSKPPKIPSASNKTPKNLLWEVVGGGGGVGMDIYGYFLELYIAKIYAY